MPGQKKRKTPFFRFSYSPMPNGLNKSKKAKSAQSSQKKKEAKF
jgi:hypothetical protein